MRFILIVFVIAVMTNCTNKQTIKEGNSIIASPTNKVKLSSEIIWEKLNPARGDQSPQAGTIWGNRKGEIATGFLAKFVDGFSSPPHIHNVTYRAMVIKGLVHNDDPNATKMWMPPGSFWTQPAGESHITASKGESIAYVEIDSGPYLVKPAIENFDNGEQPMNLSRNNIIWLDHNNAAMIENENSEIAYLWKNEKLNGKLIKVKKGFKGEIQNTGDIFHAVVIEGEIEYGTTDTQNLDSGSYFSSTEKSKHKIKSVNNLDCLIYIRTNGDIFIR